MQEDITITHCENRQKVIAEGDFLENMIDEAINITSGGADLSSAQMRAVMEEIMTGAAQTPQIVSLLTALSNKGETVEELTAAVEVMRRHMVRIKTKKEIVLDTCGTGGDKSGTFNISTCAAFVAAGCAVTVAKHGNRSVSSCCGSADIFEALGVNINMSAERIGQCLDEVGIAFLFAQNLHPAMKYAMPARKEIGRRTMFNILGPLSNPASATHQLVGVYDQKWVKILAQVLAGLGTIHALVGHSEDGLDEISTIAKTFVCEAKKSATKCYWIDSMELGFKKASLNELTGGGVSENVNIIMDVLKGEAGARRDIVVLNAAAAIYTADRAGSIKEAIQLAAEAIDSGQALAKLELLKRFSNQ